MKVKDVVKGFPAKKDNSGCENKKQLCPFCKENDGYNQALEEIGNLEIDEKTLRKNGWVKVEELLSKGITVLNGKIELSDIW